MRDWENEFFGGKASVGNCKTDIRDTGDSYVLEAEMAGFQKDEIHLDVQGDTLTITAEHKEKTRRAPTCGGNGHSVRISRSWTSATSTLTRWKHLMKTAC